MDREDGADKKESGEDLRPVFRRISDQAGKLLGPDLDDSVLRSSLGQVLQDQEDLVDSERKQLAQFAQLAKDGPAAEAAQAIRCDGRFSVKSARDEMLLLLAVDPPVGGGRAVESKQVVEYFKHEGITRGVDVPAIVRACQQAAEGECVEDVVAVQGRPAKPGQDARIERFARLGYGHGLEPLSDLQSVAPGMSLLCEEGDLVLRRLPAQEGAPGYTALGKTIEVAPPREMAVEAGRNVRVDGESFYAQVSGVVFFTDAQVEVRKALVLTRELTGKDKPVDFDGEVHVRAAVRSGAQIRATGNVVIDKPVEAATIESTEGDVILRSGVAGKNAAVIRAARDIQARFAESATLLAGRNIVLDIGSINARLTAYDQIEADRGRGQICGGMVTAGNRVSVKKLGAWGGVSTEVVVGLQPRSLEQLSKINELEAKIEQRRADSEELVQQIEHAIGDPARLEGEEKQLYLRLRQLMFVSDVQLRRLGERRQQFLAECAREHGGSVEVTSEIMCNVLIHIGPAHTSPEGQRGPCSFRYDEAKQQITLRRGV